MSGDVRAALKATELGSAAKRREGPSGDIPRCRKTGSADKPLRDQLRTLPLKTDHAPFVLVAM
jgi:hypothetical protein